MRVHAIAQEALRVKSFDLRPLSDAPLPSFTAGAHIDLLLPGGLSRSYSLVNSPKERDRYVVAVSRDERSRGGSEFMHQRLHVGDILEIHPPRNLFELEEGAEHSVLIAGGIGITPIYSMVRRLNELGRSWHLLYCARSPEQAALLPALTRLADGESRRLDLRFNEEPDYVQPDLAQLVAQAPPGAHFYCCGPASLMQDFEKATSAIPGQRVHTESFTPVSTSGGELGGFTLVLAHSGVELQVPPGQTILKAVREAGIDTPSLCEEGTCGSCEVPVLDGIPLHRDHVLSPEDKEAGTAILICCSGSKSERLTLDL